MSVWSFNRVCRRAAAGGLLAAGVAVAQQPTARPTPPPVGPDGRPLVTSLAVPATMTPQAPAPNGAGGRGGVTSLSVPATVVSTAVGTPSVGVAVPPPDVVRARDPLGVMLAEGRAATARIRDYTCTFTRQERDAGGLGVEQVGVMKVRATPVSVHVRFARPEGVAGMEVGTVAGQRADGKFRFRPAGAAGANGFIWAAADDPRAAKAGREPVGRLGVGGVLDAVATAVARERVLGHPVEVVTSEYVFAGRPVVKYDVFARRPHAHRAFYHAAVYVDKETKLPTRYEVYDEPKGGGPMAGELAAAYSYTDLKANVGLGDSAFDY